MSRFNPSLTEKNKTVNMAGGEAFKQSDKMEFATILLTSFLKDQFYRDSNDTATRLISLINDIPDKKFVAKAAVYARTKAGMRSVSHLVAGELAGRVKGEPWTKNFFDKVINRPDDMLEILSYYGFKFSGKGKLRKIPNALKKGFGSAIGRFDSYSLSKYRGESKELSLVDLVNMIHPKPTDKNREALAKLVKDELSNKKTWETKLTEAGQKAETEEQKADLKKEVWTGMVQNNEIGYFALLRNLRNILEQAPENVDKVVEQLKDEKAIKKSLVLPFRFATAYKQIQGLPSSQKILGALSDAIEISLNNVPKFDGSTVVVLDVSGSMMGEEQDIGTMFGVVLSKTNLSDFVVFSNDAKYISINPRTDMFSSVEALGREFGGGTNFAAMFRRLNKAYDRIILLSDMQWWMEPGVKGALNDYKKKFNCQTKLYSWDLRGYGTLALPEKSIYCLAGWSDKAFDTLKFLESDKEKLLNEIESIEL